MKWHDDFSALKKDSLYHKITARMCLNHSTSFMNTRWQEPDYLLRTHFEPGTRYSYSLEGFNYLQVVLEKLTNKPLEELAQEIIFKPLGMKNSSYTWKKEFENNLAYGYNAKDERYVRDTDNDPRAGSTLQTTLKDYTKFLEAVLQQKILNKASWEEFYKPSIRIRSLSQFGPLAKKDSTLNDNIKLSYGLGWGVLDSPYGKGYFKEGHANTAFQHYSIIFPEAGTGIAIMTNSVNGESIFKELLEVAIKDVYTPWKWENYIPYNHNEKEE